MTRDWNEMEKCLKCDLLSAGLTIGFDETLYSVDETAGEVRLGVSVLSGTLSSDVVVKVITMERSARGRH